MTQKELALDTFKYYNDNPLRRGISKTGSCLYKTSEGNKCAVGRWLIEDNNILEFRGSVIRLSEYLNVRKGGLSQFLKEEVKDIPPSLWGELQAWHDDPFYWTDENAKTNRDKYSEEILKNIEEGKHGSNN